MKKLNPFGLRYLLTAAALALASGVFAADPLPVVKPTPPPPEIHLPPEKPVNVSEWNAQKARDVPYHVSLVKAPEAWAKNPAARGKGLRIAVVDTGGQANHPGLNGCVKGGYNAITKREGTDASDDDNGHGTHCLGIVHSIVPDADLYVVKAMDAGGSGRVDVLAHGIEYAATTFKADVISCSFGGAGNDHFLPAAVATATRLGAVVVCAAGNDGGGPGNDTEGYPALDPDAVAVAACDSNRKLAGFSSWGPTVFTVDPGVNVTSTLPGSKVGEMSGTSMATPCEAGKVASWVGSNAVPRDASRKATYVAAVLKASPFAERNNARGYGLYQLDAVTGAVAAPKPTPGPTPAPGEKVYAVDLAKLKADGYTSVRIDLGGTAAPSGQPIPVASFPGGYGECLRAVERGETVYLAVGVNPHPGDYSTYHLRRLDGEPFKAGRYRCWKNERGESKMDPVSLVAETETPIGRTGPIVVGPGGVTVPLTPVGRPGQTCPNGQCPTRPQSQPLFPRFGGGWRQGERQESRSE